ncbi:MAG: KUP/HAK/KT family potassium transporter [Deltaproteobacteria bacterium]|nr:KUP/HAK/KT family potassium transporter [Deltaproteobacteria bacterium]
MTAHARSPLRVLVWAALGVIFGDIGTSPLYAMSETVSSHLLGVHGIHDKVTMQLGQYYGRDEVLGWTSLFVWALLVVVTVKYVMLILRADNEGEGGMFAILALLRAKAAKLLSTRGMAVLVLLAVVGSGLILGDGVITPSLTIMSAWEGLEVVTQRWSPYIPWLSVATLVALFSIQRLGTARVGAWFAPAMAVWFATLAAMGAVNLVQHPSVLAAINPWYAARYMLHFPRATLFVIGSVDLCITGCEALFADMGHFGRPAVRRAWFYIVWPALLLNYLGQGARLLDDKPIASGNVFFALVPSSPGFVYPLVIISWMASIIASQALISGAFSLVRQAMQLGLFPRVKVVHTNPDVEGQIYLPAVNWGYLLLCTLLVVGFRNSHNLAPAYGLAVTGTMAFTTILFYFVATRVWMWKARWVGPLCVGLIAVDISFFVSNATQFFQGGYITLAIAAGTAFTMMTWQKGRTALGRVIREAMLPTDLFLSSIRVENPIRVQGTAVFMTSNPGGIPHSLIHYFKHAKSLHEQVILLTVQTRHVPEVPEEQRITEITELGEGFLWVHAAWGYMEGPDIPSLMARVKASGVHINLDDVSFFLGRESLVFTGSSGMSLLRKLFFKVLSQNAVPASAFFRLPPGRVVELGIQVEI